MLTKKELEYMLIKNPPYPGEDYARMTLGKLERNIALFEEYYLGKEHEIQFSDGTPLKFEIEDKFIAHMVGLDTKKLRSSDLKVKGSTYDLIKNIIANKEDVIQYNRDNLDKGLLNFYRIKVRSDIFQKFSNIYELNFGCILYDHSMNEDKFQKTLSSKYFLFMESDEINSKYYMMGIAHDEARDANYIETLFPDTYPESMFNNQTVVIPTFMTVSNDDNYYKAIEAEDRFKLELLRKYREQLREYKVYYNLHADYEATLSKSASEKIKTKFI